ncbi:hypothetical protein IQ225_19215, partial [Synechocystis salina LEGE 06155]|nr:hypothetical protein [Synechocystis salina LEGE 06155]
MKNDANKGSVTSPRAWQIFSFLVLPPIVGWLGLTLFINWIKPSLGPVKADPRTLVVQLLRSE